MIEFVGPPGIGKSTLIKALLDKRGKYRRLEDDYIQSVYEAFHQKEDLMLPPTKDFNTLFSRLFQIILPLSNRVSPQSLRAYNTHGFSGFTGLAGKMIGRFECAYPGSMRIIQDLIKSYTDDQDRITYCLNWLFFTVEKYMLVEKYITRKDFILIDQGFVDFIGPIFVSPSLKNDFSENDIRKYIESIPIPDKIVQLEASPETCLSRMKNRKQGLPDSWKSLQKNERLERIRREIKSYKVASKYLEKQNTKVIKMDAEKPKDDLKMELDSKLEDN